MVNACTADRTALEDPPLELDRLSADFGELVSGFEVRAIDEDDDEMDDEEEDDDEEDDLDDGAVV